MNRWFSLFVALLTVVLPVPAPAAPAPTSCCADDGESCCCCRAESDRTIVPDVPSFDRAPGCPCATPVDAPTPAPTSELATSSDSSNEIGVPADATAVAPIARRLTSARRSPLPPERPPPRAWLALVQSFLL